MPVRIRAAHTWAFDAGIHPAPAVMDFACYRRAPSAPFLRYPRSCRGLSYFLVNRRAEYGVRAPFFRVLSGYEGVSAHSVWLWASPRPVRFEPDSVSQVRVSFEERHVAYLIGVRAGVAQDVQAVTDVDHVDQALVDDRVAPHNHLVGAAAEGGVLGGDRGQWLREEGPGRGRMGGVCDIDGAKPVRVPGDDRHVRQDGQVVRAVAGVGGVRGIHARRRLTVGVLVLRRPVLAYQGGVEFVGDADHVHPAPGAPAAIERGVVYAVVVPVEFVGHDDVGPSWDLHGRVGVGVRPEWPVGDRAYDWDIRVRHALGQIGRVEFDERATPHRNVCPGTVRRHRHRVDGNVVVLAVERTIKVDNVDPGYLFEDALASPADVGHYDVGQAPVVVGVGRPVHKGPIGIVRVDPQEELVRPGILEVMDIRVVRGNQPRMSRVRTADVIEAKVRSRCRRGRRTGVVEVAAAHVLHDEQLLLRPHAELTRGLANVPFKRGPDLAHNVGVSGVGDVHDQDSRVGVGAPGDRGIGDTGGRHAFVRGVGAVPHIQVVAVDGEG